MSRRAIAAKAGATGNLFVLSSLATVSGFFPACCHLHRVVSLKDAMIIIVVHRDGGVFCDCDLVDNSHKTTQLWS